MPQVSYRQYKYNKLRNLLKSHSSTAINVGWIDWYPHWNNQKNHITDMLDVFNLSYQIVDNLNDADLIFAGVYDSNLLRTRIYESKFVDFN